MSSLHCCTGANRGPWPTMSLRRSAALFVVVVLFASTGALMSQGRAEETGIFGYVLAPGDMPVSGGTVAYMTFGASALTTVDGSGRFRIPVDRAGVFRVSVSVPGFAPYQFTATAPA